MVDKGKIVLVVEDEVPLLEAISIKLEKNGFGVLKARSSEQAKQHLKSIINIDVVWLDHYLIGEENGLDLLRWCKNDERHKKIPIFVISNTLTSEKVDVYMNLGAEKYFIKSNFRLDEIIEEINKVLLKESNM